MLGRASIFLHGFIILPLWWNGFLFSVQFSNSSFLQVGEMKAEITRLHKQLFEQEKKLQNTMKLLQLSKHQEKIIFDQCE